MKRFLSLVKVNLLMSLSRSGQSMGGKKKKLTGGKVLMALLFLGFFLMFTVMGKNFADSARDNGLLPLMGYSIVQFSIFIVLMSMVTFTTSTLYHGVDTRIYFSMPFRSIEVLGAKFVALYLEALLVEAYLTVPFVIGTLISVSSVQAGLGWLLTILILPLMPTAMVAILITMLLKIVPGMRDQQRLLTLSTLTAMIGGAAVGLLMPRFMEGVVQAGAQGGQASGWISAFLPSLSFGPAVVYGASEGILANAGLLVLVNVLWMAAAIGITALFYRPLILSLTDGKKGKALSDAALSSGAARTASPLKALVQREIKSIMRVPTYVMGGVITPYFMLVIIAGSILYSTLKGAGAGFDLQAIRSFVESFLVGDALKTLTAGVGVGLVMAMQVTTGSMAATAFSRDARHIDFLNAIPVPGKEIFLAKLLGSYLLGAPLLVILWGLSFVVAPFYPLFQPVLMVVSLLVSIAINLIDLLIDAKSPKLHWMDETALLRNNKNVMISMIFSMGYLIILAPLLFAGLLQPAIFVLTVLYVISGAVVAFYLEKNADRLLRQMAMK